MQQPQPKKPRPKSPIPKRALPNKPLPSKPLPSKPLTSKPLPKQIQQPIQQPIQPQKPQQQHPDENASYQQSKAEPEPEPEPYMEPQVEPEQEQEQEQEQEPEPKEEPQQQQQQDEEKQTDNNWYKPRTKPKKSYQAVKTCKLLLDDKKNKVKKVKLFAEYDKFFVAEGNSKNRGFQVASICNNEYGKAFEKMGIDPGWRVTKVGNKALPIQSFPMLKNRLLSMGQKCGNKGYYLMFDGNPPTKEEEEKQKQNNYDDISQLTAAPVSLGKNSVELIASYNDHKIVKIKHSLEKYIDFASVKGPKGYKISAFKAKFGNDLKQYGIDIDWRVIKLGDKDVANMFTQMIKTNLDVEWRNNKANGVTVTFGMPI